MKANEKVQGLVIRSHGHIYYVAVSDPAPEVLECRPRGRFRVCDDGAVLAGDQVEVVRLGGGEGVIDNVLPRREVLTRPPVANVDQALVVFTAHQPELDMPLLDRFLVLAESAGLDVLLCLNKVDLCSQEEVNGLVALYGGVGYRVFPMAAALGRGVEALRAELDGKTSVLAGQSGVGKSSLLNALEPHLRLRTGDVSAKLGRGRHTTRHVELLPLTPAAAGGRGGYVADTPGFSYLDLSHIAKEELAGYFPEFDGPAEECRFSGCLHHKEPDCGVKHAVEEGRIAGSRYDNYLRFLQELSDLPPRYPKKEGRKPSSVSNLHL